MGKEIIWNLVAKKLSGEASEEELKALELLLKEDPELHYPIQTITDLWRTRETADQDAADRAFSRHLDRMHNQGVDFNSSNNDPAPGKPGPKRKLIYISAAVLAVLAILLTTPFYPRKQPASAVVPQSNSEISTRNGSRTNLVLPDGSKVWLNAGSKLTYDKEFGNKLREVSLSGEAYFDVEKNPEKPFVIHTGKIEIRVLGTSFNVKSYPEEKTIETSLIRGSIEVTFNDRPNEKVVLRPNEKLVVTNEPAPVSRKQPVAQNKAPLVAVDHLNYSAKDSTIIETAWVQNKLFFRDQSFYRLAQQMQRWYGVDFNFDHSGRDSLHFSGSFENETVQQALDALKITAHFNYSIRGNTVNISR